MRLLTVNLMIFGKIINQNLNINFFNVDQPLGLSGIYKKKIENNKAWIMTVVENKKLLGYAICLEKNNEKIALKRITIIDLVSLKDNEEVHLSLIKGCISESKKRGYHMLEVVGFKNLKRKIFYKFKTFNRKFSNFPFYYKNGKLIDKNFLSTEDIWDSSLIDGDSFL